MEELQDAYTTLREACPPQAEHVKSHPTSLADSEDTGFGSMTSVHDAVLLSLDADATRDSSDDEGTIVSSRISCSNLDETCTSTTEASEYKEAGRSLKAKRYISPPPLSIRLVDEVAEAEELDDNCEFDIDRVELKKTSSLKARKTPPGTPSHQKYVRFADALGLDLTRVRLMRDQESPPRVPDSAFRHLSVRSEPTAPAVGEALYLSPWFTANPGSNPSFMWDVRANKVLLERVHVTELAMTGTIRVLNLAFDKQVTVRHTCDSWCSHHDEPAAYVPDSSRDDTDAFSFVLRAPQHFRVGGRIEFCIRYVVADREFWDSNEGHNYVLECYARLVRVTPLQPAECNNNLASFY